ncbi:Phosphate regulon transcriptional regulatory protein PhoB (SphR) [Chitinispirillum alkaliphilum]|nr:Phosphate regulon transcriptional regulatory protein PhoB (SphR) [Chitinispirillum alkaliphilum]
MSKNVLIIEDEKVLSELVRVNLVLRGIPVETAYTAQSGLDKAFKIRPDIILLDVRLPDFTGWEVCKKLKSQKTDEWNPVIVFLTAATQASDKKTAKESGGDDFVEKPFEMSELVKKVKELLGP